MEAAEPVGKGLKPQQTRSFPSLPMSSSLSMSFLLSPLPFPCLSFSVLSPSHVFLSQSFPLPISFLLSPLPFLVLSLSHVFTSQSSSLSMSFLLSLLPFLVLSLSHVLPSQSSSLSMSFLLSPLPFLVLSLSHVFPSQSPPFPMSFLLSLLPFPCLSFSVSCVNTSNEGRHECSNTSNANYDYTVIKVKQFHFVLKRNAELQKGAVLMET